MNDVIKCLNERSSFRSFLDKKIPEQVLRQVIDAGCHAATGGNLQPYSIIKIDSEEKKDALMATGHMQSIVRNAPTSLLFCIDWHRIERWALNNKAPFSVYEGYRHFWIGFQDTIIAAQSVETACNSLGLGTVYLGTVESCFDQVVDIFKLPVGVMPVVILSIGYPKDEQVIAPKLMGDVIMHDNEYTELSDDKLNQVMAEKYKSNTPIPVSPKKLETLYKVTKAVHGSDYAETVVQHANDAGVINTAQRYFGLHYSADWSRTDNPMFINALKKCGYQWVEGKDHKL